MTRTDFRDLARSGASRLPSQQYCWECGYWWMEQRLDCGHMLCLFHAGSEHKCGSANA